MAKKNEGCLVQQARLEDTATPKTPKRIFPVILVKKESLQPSDLTLLKRGMKIMWSFYYFILPVVVAEQ